MRQLIFFLMLMMFFISCKHSSNLNVDVSDIKVDVVVDRFEQDFYKANAVTLKKVKQKYPSLFPHHIDSVWVNKINNSEQRELFNETTTIYKSFAKEKTEIENLFKHVKFYNRSFVEPKIITMITSLDSRVIYADSLMFVSLDNFLGKEHKFYDSFPKYLKENNTRDHMIVDIANSIVDKQFRFNSKRKFIEKIIFEGKKMYLLDLYLPDVNEVLKFGCSQEKYQWLTANEEGVWRYFIDKELLFSTDNKLNKRFIDVAPFSKFYLGHDNLSPGRVGVYIGWQIVKSFMTNNDVSLQVLMQTEGEEIFKKSKYKPRK